MTLVPGYKKSILQEILVMLGIDFVINIWLK
jgi:hypothetical protein